jgi:hypothetical protein
VLERNTVNNLEGEIKTYGYVEVPAGRLSEWTGADPDNADGREQITAAFTKAGFSISPNLDDGPPPAMVRIGILGRDLTGSISRDAKGLRQEAREYFQTSRSERRGAAEQEIADEIQVPLAQAAEITEIDSDDNLLEQTRLVISAFERAERHNSWPLNQWTGWTAGRLNEMRTSGELNFGSDVAQVGPVLVFSDRIYWEDGDDFYVWRVDEHLKASLMNAGQITRRPTLTRMAIGSVIPGTALIPGLAWQKETDTRQLFFVFEHPTWTKIVEVKPEDLVQFQHTVVVVNQAAAAVGHAKPEPETASAPDAVAELKQLAELHRSGALTDDEFAAMKAQIIERGQS